MFFLLLISIYAVAFAFVPSSVYLKVHSHFKIPQTSRYHAIPKKYIQGSNMSFEDSYDKYIEENFDEIIRSYEASNSKKTTRKFSKKIASEQDALKFSEFNKRYQEYINQSFEDELNKDFNYEFAETCKKPTFVMMWYKSDVCDSILHDMKTHNMNTYFCDRSCFDKIDLDRIYKKHVKNVKFDHKNEPWIFKDDEFIGGIFEVYQYMFYN
jgi:hypothetical protein